MSGPERYTKRPVTVEAMQLTDTNALEVFSWIKKNGARPSINRRQFGGYEGSHITIPTLEGPMLANPGDWIIQGIQGEFYPCKPDIFNATYTKENQK